MSFGARCTMSCNTWVLVAMLGCMVVASGCRGGGGGASSSAQSERSTSSSPPSTVPNQAPAISGSPGSGVTEGQKYTFVPVASDPDGDSLGFSISNRPAWAQFDTTTGRLTGTPAANHVGSFGNIRISVSDGKTTTALPAFSLKVAKAGSTSPAPATGAATLSWSAPTENLDGSELTDLSGYRIRFGTSADQLTQEITIDSPGTTVYMITDLAPATYFFAIQALTSRGAESPLSGVASKTII